MDKRFSGDLLAVMQADGFWHFYKILPTGEASFKRAYPWQLGMRIAEHCRVPIMLVGFN